MHRAAEAAWGRLASQSASLKPLAVMRILLGGVLLAQARVLWTYRSILLDPLALLPWSVTDAWIDPFAPKLSNLLPLFSAAGLGPEVAVAAVLGVHALAAAFLMIGYRTRISAFVAWGTYVLIRDSSMAFMYGLGAVLLILLFYCLFMPVGRVWSVDRMLIAPAKRPDASTGGTPSVVILRLHLCIMYAGAAIAKSVGDQWWSGDALWRALSLPQFQQFDPTPLLAWPLVLQVASIGAMLSQLAYPVLVWTRLRVLIVIVTELMHLGIAIFLGLWMFSLAMIALNTAAFGESVWRTLAHRRSAALSTPRA